MSATKKTAPKPEPVITRDDWMQAIAEVQRDVYAPAPPGAITSQQYAKLSGRCHSVARRQLAMLVERGRARKVSMRVQDADGFWRPRVGYVLVKP